MHLRISDELLRALKNAGVEIGTSMRHVCNAQKAVEKIGQTEMPNTEE